MQEYRNMESSGVGMEFGPREMEGRCQADIFNVVYRQT